MTKDPERNVTERLIAKARAKAADSLTCLRPTTLVPVGEVALGWSFQVDMYRHDGTEHWGLSVKLFPFGRGSSERDWQVLGSMLALIVKSTGYPAERPMPEPLTPIETTHPNATLHWMWHADGSEVDPMILEMTAAILSAMTPRDPQAPPVTVPNPPSGVRSGEYTLYAYGHTRGIRGQLEGPAVTLSWYGSHRRAMRTTLTAKECRAYIAALALELERAEGGTGTEKTKEQP